MERGIHQNQHATGVNNNYEHIFLVIFTLNET